MNIITNLIKLFTVFVMIISFGMSTNDFIDQDQVQVQIQVQVHNQKGRNFVDYIKYTSLLVIDTQGCFMNKNASLYVSNSASIIDPINSLMKLGWGGGVILTQDWHPPNHISFASSHNEQPFTMKKISSKAVPESIDQMLWPTHCVQNTQEAEIHPYIETEPNMIVIRKGQNIDVDSYSAFGDQFGGKYENTFLHRILSSNGVNTLVLTGLATDYCVFHTAKDAVRLGYKVYLIENSVKGVDPITTSNVMDAMRNMGVVIVKNENEYIRSVLEI